MTSGTAGVAVGVDAGGSGSRAVVVRDGVVVARRDLGPINVLLHPDAVDRLAAGPDAVVVEMGLPGPVPPARGWIATGGASAASARAAAELLLGTAP